MNQLLKKLFFLTIILCPLFVFIGLAQAETQINFTPQVSIPGDGSPFQSQQPFLVKNDTSLICDYIIAVYKYAIAIVGVLAVLAIAIGGVMWVVAAGNSGTISEGKQWITSGFLGLLLALGSFLLLATINRDLVTCKVTTIPGTRNLASATKKTEYSNKTLKVVPKNAACLAMISYDGEDLRCDDPVDLLVESPIARCNNLPEFQTYPKSKCCCPDQQKYGQADFCQTADEGDTCMVGDSWGYCENQKCRACRQPTDVLFNVYDNNSTISAEELKQIPEINKCYRNAKNYECQAPFGNCGNKGHGNCNMYTWDSDTGKLVNVNPLYASTHACNQGDNFCVCELF